MYCRKYNIALSTIGRMGMEVGRHLGNGPTIRQNIGQNIAGCSLMWLMPLRSLSNCDYEL